MRGTGFEPATSERQGPQPCCYLVVIIETINAIKIQVHISIKDTINHDFELLNANVI